MAAVIAGCEDRETGEALAAPPPSPMILPSDQPTVQPTARVFVLGPLIDSNPDLRARPAGAPLELEIPSLKVSAPVLAVGLTAKDVTDSPRGDIGDPIWSTAFWTCAVDIVNGLFDHHTVVYATRSK